MKNVWFIIGFFMGLLFSLPVFSAHATKATTLRHPKGDTRYIYNAEDHFNESTKAPLEAFSPDALARMEGQMAQAAEYSYYVKKGTYAGRLKSLIRIDHNLLLDPGVTFTFGPCNNSGYTFATRHANGENNFAWHDNAAKPQLLQALSNAMFEKPRYFGCGFVEADHK